MKSNYHTHSVYCDGADTLSEMACVAYEKGFDILGFSGHSYTRFDASFCMSKENTLKYKTEVARLKQEYAGKMQILCGIEADYFSDIDDGFDFVIGSVHYVKKEGKYLAIDESSECLQNIIKTYYNNDCYALSDDYFALVSKVVAKTKADIVGHFDLLTKFDESAYIFDYANVRFKNAALKALESVAESKAILEINTGAMARGYASMPYPREWLLDSVQELGIKVMLTSDCHNKENLDFGYDVAQKLVDKYNLEVVTCVNI